MAKLFYPLVLILALILSGCSMRQKTENQGDEILIAHDCGMDKLQCCKSEPICNYSQQCCADPNNQLRNYCSDQCTFGGKDEFCNQGSKCNDGFACSKGICKICGSENNICCAEDQCGSGLVCDGGKCVKCGIEGNVCCTGDRCGNESKNDGSRTGCIANKCLQCGSGGQACPGDMKCLPGYLHNNGVCFKCGDPNEPCCDKGAGLGYDCDPKKYLSCYQGFCLQ